MRSRLRCAFGGGTAHDLRPTWRRFSEKFDLARLEAAAETDSCDSDIDLPEPGAPLVFAGLPQGLSVPSVFPGMVSAIGVGLVRAPKCELIQIAGMVNNGNSGGPLLHSETGRVLGVVTAKYVPLLEAIDRMVDSLEAIPQFPSEVEVQKIDFGRFVNMTVRGLWQVAAVLRLVQVGTGWAVPAKFFGEVGG